MRITKDGIRHVVGSITALVFLTCVVAGVQQTHPWGISVIGVLAFWGIR